MTDSRALDALRPADPRSPDLPISAPSSYSREIAEDIGPFYTQGIAEDTSAYRQGVLNLREFQRQSTIVRRPKLLSSGWPSSSTMRLYAIDFCTLRSLI